MKNNKLIVVAIIELVLLAIVVYQACVAIDKNELLELENNRFYRWYSEENEANQQLREDYESTLKKSAHFTIAGKAIVKDELTDEEEEVEINEHLLAIPEKNTLPAEYSLLWNNNGVIDLQLEVTSPEGEVRLNYEKNTSITETGAYVVSVLGKDGNYEATVVVGKDQRKNDSTPKMHITVW